MKTIRPILFLLIAIASLAALPVQGQSSLDKIVVGSQQDANYLVSGYASPALSIIGYGLNQGWYNTAKPHKLLGIDITTTINFIRVPSSDRTYYVDNSKLTQVDLMSGPTASGGTPQSGYVPTAFGPDNTPLFRYRSGPTAGQEFSGAPGVDLSKVPVVSNSLPVPVAQIGLGLPKGFDVKVRFVPTIKFGDNNASSFSMFGIGVMHDIKQYLPGVKALPFDLSGFVGYTNMKMNVVFDASHGQQGSLTSNATTIQGVISKKLAVLTAYAGLGYNFATTKASVSGDYDLTASGVYTPMNINLSASSTGPRATFGLRLKLAVFTFHGEYTAQKYSSISLGFGISVR